MAVEFVNLSRSLSALTMVIIVLILPVHGQINTACSPSALTSFTSCINFITNSTANGTSPTTDCCNSLRAITTSSTDCLCLIVTGSVPFQIPINRTLAIALPRACNMPGVPLQCKASVAPLPAPGPAALAPTLSPGFSPSASPEASSVPEAHSPAMTPESNATPTLTPPSDTTGAGAPTTNSGIRPVLTPSAATKATGGCFLQGINLEPCRDQDLSFVSESCCRAVNQALEIGLHCLCMLLPVSTTIPLLHFPSDLPLSNCYISVPSLAQCKGPTIPGLFTPAIPASEPLSPGETRQPAIPPTLPSINSTLDDSAAMAGPQNPSSKDAQSLSLSHTGNVRSHCDKVKNQLHHNVRLLVITHSLYLIANYII
ncbi:hypothetical protein ACET3Z_029590 [Daucus carota]